MFLIVKKAFRILFPNFGQRILFIIFLFFIGSIIETLSVGLILPLIQIFLNPDKLKKLTPISNIFSENITSNKLLIIAIILLIIFFIVKNILLILIQFFNNTTIEKFGSFMATKILNKFLSNNYIFHVNSNYSDLVKSVQVESSHFTSYIRSGLTIISEGLIMLTLIIFIMSVEFWGTLFTFSIVLLGTFIFYRYSNNKLSKLGEKRDLIEADLSKITIDSLAGIREIKLLNKEHYFGMKFKNQRDLKANILARYNTYVQAPLYFLESIAILAIFSITGWMFFYGIDKMEIIARLALFIGTAFKLIPSANKILSSVNNIKFYEFSVNKISNYLLENYKLKRPNANKISLKKKIDIINLCYKIEEKSILKNINLKIMKGDSIAIIGESGSGKTTFLNILSGLIYPSSGSVNIDDRALTVNDIIKWQRCIGYVGQDTFLIDDSIRNNIAFGLNEEEIDEKKILKTLKDVDLYGHVINLKEGIHTKIGERGSKLSGGQRQRLGIARVLLKNPDILIFDEVTSALDNETQKNILDTIIKLKTHKTVIFVTHRSSLLNNFNFVYRINKGELFKE